MTHISVPASLDQIEADLASVKNEQIIVDVSLKSLSDFQDRIMLESALIQWIVTRWRLTSNRGAFKTDELDSNDKNQLLNQLGVSAPGAVLSLLPEGKIDGVTRQMTAHFRQKFFEKQNHWPDLALSESAFLLCLDSYPKLFPHHLYIDRENYKLVDLFGYSSLVNGLVKSVVKEAQSRKEVLKRADIICSILLELFKNTQQHAILEVNGSRTDYSVRGLYSRYYPAESIQYTYSQNEVSKKNPIYIYIQNLIGGKQNHAKHRYIRRSLTGFLELSVFDTGPGMAAKWLGKPISAYSSEEQYEAVIGCLAKGNSSSHETGRGFGLSRVLQHLRQANGFIRIRTNRINAYRDFGLLKDYALEEQADGYQIPKEKLYDWKRVIVSSPSEYGAITGTLVSILLPLGEL